MTLIKCPRCDLNYITPDQKYCKVCLREMRGEGSRDEIELCSICNEQPALPGKDVCMFCLKEMNKSNSENTNTDDEGTMNAGTIGMEDVTDMDEMIPDDDPGMNDREYGEMEQAMSLEQVRQDEEDQADEDEDEEET